MRPKRLLILSSNGGHGHIAATNTLIQLLGKEWQIDVIYPIHEVRLLGVPSGEAFYNFCLANNLTKFTNFYAKFIAPPIFFQHNDKTKNLIAKHIEEKRPDMIISVVPFINFPASEAARKYNLPFLLVTTDNDLRNWALFLDRRKNTHFQVTIGSHLPTSTDLLLKQKVNKEQIFSIGLPLRPEFSVPKDRSLLHKKYSIPPNKKVVLLMMGGVGARSCYSYAKTIMNSPLGIHLIVCAGKNTSLISKLKKVAPAFDNTMEVIPFTPKIDELFYLSDLIITKPGPGTINEAMAIKLPILLDRTQTPLFWEQANIDLVHKLKVGTCIYNLEEIPDLLKRYLYDAETRKEIAKAYESLPKNEFSTQIATIIDKLATEGSVVEAAIPSSSYSHNTV